MIEEGKFERAIGDLDRLIELKSNRTDAALYWKAYSLSKLGRKADALSALADLQQQFKDSRWAEGREGARSRGAPGVRAAGVARNRRTTRS